MQQRQAGQPVDTAVLDVLLLVYCFRSHIDEILCWLDISASFGKRLLLEHGSCPFQRQAVQLLSEFRDPCSDFIDGSFEEFSNFHA